jgi:Holliday junction resolvasome RuvABC endonuclease subunit
MHRPVVIGIDPGSHTAGIAVVEENRLLFHRTVDSLTNAKWDDEMLGYYMVEFMLAVQEAIDEYDPELLVVELTSVPVNMHTNKLLAYWEACAIIAASMANINIKRLRTGEARKLVFGKGNIKKEAAVNTISSNYNIAFDENEAEAIIFALAGVKSFEHS